MSVAREEILESINDEVEQVPTTTFDKFDIRINRKSVGRGLRDDLGDIFNQYGRINELASHSTFLAEKAKARKDKVFSMATKIVNSDPAKMNAETKKNLIKITNVQIDGETTTFIEEEERCALYNFLANRGKDKVYEISKMLDLGRSLLSFDKSEIDRMGHD